MIDTIEDFIVNFKAQFDDLDGTEDFSPDSEYRNIVGWDSLTSIMVLAMIDEQYNIEVNGDDIFNTKTIRELYLLLEQKRLNSI